MMSATTQSETEPIVMVGAPLAIIDGISFAGGQEWTNWNKNLKARPERTYFPNTVEDLQAIVRHATEDNKKIRVLGMGHSWSSVAVTEDYLVLTSNLNKIHDPVKTKTASGEEQWTVKIEAGTTVKELEEFLGKHNPPLAMRSNVVITDARYGGLLTMGTHGPMLVGRSMSDHVAELTIVNGKGELVSYSEASDPEAFSVASLSLGVLGIIYSVTLKIVPEFNVRADDVFAPLNQVLQAEFLKDQILNSEAFEMFHFPFESEAVGKGPNDRFYYRRWTKSDEPVDMKKPSKTQPEFDHPFFSTIVEGSRVTGLTESLHFISEGEFGCLFHDCSLAIKVNDDFSNVVEVFTDLIRLNNEFSNAAPGREATVVESRFNKASSKIMSQIYDEDPNAVYMQLNLMAVTGVPGYEEFMVKTAAYIIDKYNAK